MQTMYAPTSTDELMLGDDRRQEEGPLRRYCHYFSFTCSVVNIAPAAFLSDSCNACFPMVVISVSSISLTETNVYLLLLSLEEPFRQPGS